MISDVRFGWIEYHNKDGFFLKFWQFVFGILFLHSRYVAKELFKCMEITNTNENILDIGCGSGTFSNWIAYKSGAKVIGSDRLETRVNKGNVTAKKFNLPCQYRCLDIAHISFKESSFDKIIAIDVLEHLIDPEITTKKIYHWLKPQGKLFISVPYKKQKRWFNKKIANVFSYGFDMHYVEGYEEKDLIKMLENVGFSRIYIKPIFFAVYQVIWELTEGFRQKHANCYRLVTPLLFPVIWLDRLLAFGPYNGLLVVASK